DLASAAYARWKRAVDLLIREVGARRRSHAEASDETARAVRRMRSLRKIVRKALSEYSRIQMARSSRESAAAARESGGKYRLLPPHSLVRAFSAGGGPAR